MEALAHSWVTRTERLLADDQRPFVESLRLAVSDLRSIKPCQIREGPGHVWVICALCVFGEMPSHSVGLGGLLASRTLRCVPKGIPTTSLHGYFRKAHSGPISVSTLKGVQLMLRLIAAAGFVVAVATSAQAITPTPVPQPDGMITQVRFGCGPFRTRVAGVCVARPTIRHTRRMVRRAYRRGY